MATSYNVEDLNSKLTNYLEANRDELIAKTIFNNHASDHFNLMVGVKNPTALISVDIKTPVKDGSDCGFNPDGEDVFSDRIITPAALTVQKEFCTKTLLGSWKSKDISFTAGRETMPFEEFFMEKIAENINAEVERLIMAGDTSASDPDPMEGLINLINDDIDDNIIPAANVIAKGSDDILTRCQKLWAACDAETLKNAEIWMSVGMYKQLILDIQNANNVNVYVVDGGEYTMTLPGTSTVIRGISSMPDSADMIIMTDFEANVTKSVDVENATERLDVWYSKDDQVFKMNWFAYIGVNYANPETIYVNE